MSANAPAQPSASAEAMLKAAREFGVRFDQPDGVFVQAMADAVAAFERKVDTHRDLPVGEITNAMRRAAAAGMEQAARAYQRGQDRRTAAIVIGTGIAVMLGAFGGGYVTGWEQCSASLDGAAAQISQLASQCSASAYRLDNGTACTIRLWVKPPLAR